MGLGVFLPPSFTWGTVSSASDTSSHQATLGHLETSTCTPPPGFLDLSGYLTEWIYVEEWLPLKYGLWISLLYFFRLGTCVVNSCLLCQALSVHQGSRQSRPLPCWGLRSRDLVRGYSGPAHSKTSIHATSFLKPPVIPPPDSSSFQSIFVLTYGMCQSCLPDSCDPRKDDLVGTLGEKSRFYSSLSTGKYRAWPWVSTQWLTLKHVTCCDQHSVLLILLKTCSLSKLSPSMWLIHTQLFLVSSLLSLHQEGGTVPPSPGLYPQSAPKKVPRKYFLCVVNLMVSFFAASSWWYLRKMTHVEMF